jgi:ELWxxDGT repeat protein
MKKLIQLSLVAATLALLGGCGGSSDPQTVLSGATTDSSADTALSSVQTGLEGIVPGTGVVTAVEVEDTGNPNTNNTPVLETGRFLRGTSPAIKSLFFPADNGQTGIELYRYDLVSKSYTYTDIRAGALGSNPQFLTEVNGKIYFSANDGANGRELWIYDGTTNTATIRNINVTIGAGSNPQFITELNGRLYFSADDNTGEGRELYFYDIATNQHGYVRNHLLQTLRPGPAGANPTDLRVENGVLYFSANEGTGFGRELYKYDPVLNADTGPVRVADINPGAGGSNPVFMADIDNKVYFSANDGITGRELWVYDSVTNIAREVADINPGAASANPFFLTAVDGSIFLAADNGNPAIGPNFELMRYDINLDMVFTATEISLAFGSFPIYLTEMNGELYFGGFRAISIVGGGVEYTGMELWKYNLATGKTTLVDNLAKGLFQNSVPFWLTEANGMLYFGAQDSLLNGRELWKSDGVNQSQPVGNFNPGPGSFLPNPAIYNFPYETMLKTTW